MKLTLFIASALLIASTLIGQTRSPHVGVANSVVVTCPQGNAYADGCAAAPTTGQFQRVNFFTYARQSGQPAYPTRAPWNVAGVDYPIGAYTPDAALLDPLAVGIPNCSYDGANLYFRCNTAAVIKHYRFNGIGLFFPAGTGTDLTLEDNHFTMTATNCQKYPGLGLITGPTKGTVTATSNTLDFDATCQVNADLYKWTGDPGFVTQSSGTGGVSGTTLTYSSVNSGAVLIGQYVDCPGCMHPAQVISGSGLNWQLQMPTNTQMNTVTISGNVLTYSFLSTGNPNPVAGDWLVGSGITPGTFLVSSAGSKSWNISASYTITTPIVVTTFTPEPVISGVTITTGPVKSRPATFLTGGSPTNTITMKYNVDLGMADLGGMGFGPIDSQFNYVEANGQRTQHVNMLQIQQNQAGTVAFIKQNFNTYLWNAASWDSGTTTIGQFTTGPSNNTPVAPHGEVFTTLSQMSNNTLITNLSTIPNQDTTQTTGAVLRYLTQGSSGVSASFGATQTSTTMSVLSMSTGAGTLGVGQLVICTGCSVAGTNALKIVSQLTGSPGDVGDYQMDRSISLPIMSTGTASLSGTNLTYSSTPTGIATGQYIACTGCTVPAKITGGSGVNYTVDVSQGTLTARTVTTSRPWTTWLPGEITTLEQKDNYIDYTGAISIYVDDPNSWVGTLTRTGNINIRTGSACNSNTVCP